MIFSTILSVLYGSDGQCACVFMYVCKQNYIECVVSMVGRVLMVVYVLPSCGGVVGSV